MTLPPVPRRPSQLARIAGALGALALLAGCGADPEPAAFGQTDAQRGVALVAGIPQSGNTLGDPDAPARASLYLRLTETDVHLDRDVLPAIVQRYVRTGRLRVQLRTVPTDELDVDGAAEASARVAQAAGLRDTRMWQFALAFRAVGTGSADDATTLEALRYAGVRDAGAVLRSARDPRVTKALERVRRRAEANRIEPPTLLVARGDAVAARIPLGSGPSAQAVLRRVARAIGPQRSSTSR